MTMKVEPVEGSRLPLEGQPRRYVDKKMNVPNSAYYRRALRRGDIKLAGDSSAKKAKS